MGCSARVVTTPVTRKRESVQLGAPKARLAPELVARPEQQTIRSKISSCWFRSPLTTSHAASASIERMSAVGIGADMVGRDRVGMVELRMGAVAGANGQRSVSHPAHQTERADFRAYPNHLPTVPCRLPRRIERVRVSIASPLTLAFPKWQEGRHPHCHFRGLLRLHSVTARRIAQPPKATFVTRLQPNQLPSQAARQLPDLSTIIRGILLHRCFAPSGRTAMTGLLDCSCARLSPPVFTRFCS